MDSDFWQQRWKLNQIAFHEAEVHRLLRAHWQRLAPPPGEGAFVPLCGKSLDMGWLRREGHPVVGVELSPLAVGAFFSAAGLTPTRRPHRGLERWQASDVTIYSGDFFALEPEDVAECGMVFDRGALVALPPAMRRDYVAHLRKLFPQRARLLLITLEYPQDEMNGPPFSVGVDEVNALYGSAELLAREEVLEQNLRFRERGLTRLCESAYVIEI